MTDVQLLLRATLRMYKESLSRAWKGLRLNWWLPLLHIGYLVIVGLLSPVAMLFGPLLGGFIVGALLALLLGSYLAGVAYGVRGERMEPRELWPNTVALFGPVISVLFVFFLLQLLLDRLIVGPQVVWIRASINLLIAVLLNVLPEVIYQRPGFSMEMFGTSLEFVKENFIEWFVPGFAVLLLLGLVSWGLAASIGLLVLTTNPLYLLEHLLLVGLTFGRLISNLPYLLVSFAIIYYVFLFRGLLFERLAGSTRRKRIYQERQL